MGTHPIFESDFDCLTDRLTQKWTRTSLRSSRLTSESEAKVLPAGRRRSCTRLPTLTTKNSSRSSRSSPSTLFPVSRKLTCSEMLPNIVNQLGPEGFASLRKLAMEKVGEEAKLETPKDDDVPELEGDFEEASKQEEAEAKTEAAAEPVE